MRLLPWQRAKIKACAEALVTLDPEAAVSLLDSGVLDEKILRQAPPEAHATKRTQYADVQPFSYEDWKCRHNASEAD